MLLRRRSAVWLFLVVVVGYVDVGCAKRPPDVPFEDGVVVFAAASLRDAFTALAPSFEREHPGAKVTFNFAGTQELRAQLEQGAPVDVFASADQKHMGELVKNSRVVRPVVFARNEPVVVVAKGSEATLKTFADLAHAERVVVGAPEVPIGRYTQKILEQAAAGPMGADFRKQVEAHVVSRELNVRQVLAKVTLGEAQAGVVYRTDAKSAEGKVGVVAIPAGVNVLAEYPIAAVAGGPHPQLARAWVTFVMSEASQKTLRDAGFLAPTP
jgi:molybdate transport system substrate-binding protein